MLHTSNWEEVLRLAGSPHVRYIKHVEYEGREYPAYRDDSNPHGELVLYTRQ